jgi:hypothetical protein
VRAHVISTRISNLDTAARSRVRPRRCPADLVVRRNDTISPTSGSCPGSAAKPNTPASTSQSKSSCPPPEIAPVRLSYVCTRRQRGVSCPSAQGSRGCPRDLDDRALRISVLPASSSPLGWEQPSARRQKSNGVVTCSPSPRHAAPRTHSSPRRSEPVIDRPFNITQHRRPLGTRSTLPPAARSTATRARRESMLARETRDRLPARPQPRAPTPSPALGAQAHEIADQLVSLAPLTRARRRPRPAPRRSSSSSPPAPPRPPSSATSARSAGRVGRLATRRPRRRGVRRAPARWRISDFGSRALCRVARPSASSASLISLGSIEPLLLFGARLARRDQGHRVGVAGMRTARVDDLDDAPPRRRQRTRGDVSLRPARSRRSPSASTSRPRPHTRRHAPRGGTTRGVVRSSRATRAPSLSEIVREVDHESTPPPTNAASTAAAPHRTASGPSCSR